MADEALAAFLAEAGRTPLLEPGQEAVLARELRDAARERDLTLLGSPRVWARLVALGGELADGGLPAAALMPRGRKSPAGLAAFRRRFALARRALRRALARGAPRRAVAERLERVGLGPKTLARLAAEVRGDALRLVEARAALARLAEKHGGLLPGAVRARRPRELFGPAGEATRDRARARELSAEAAALGAAPGGAEELLALSRALAARDARVERARTALVEANILLAVSVAKRFSHPRVDFADLVQEGALGLMKAAERYDERKGFRFSTYATWWVRQSIQRALADKASLVRLPAHMLGLGARIKRLQDRFRDAAGREPGVAELARRLRIAPERLGAAVSASQEPLSFSAGEEDDGPPGLEERLPERAAPSPLAAARSALRADEVRAALDRLPARAARVVRLRFGLDDGRARSLEETGRLVGLTREGVRQAEAQALRALKAPAVAARLRDYLGSGQ